MEIAKEWVSFVSTALGLVVALFTVTPKGLKWLRRVSSEYIARRLRDIFGEQWVDEEIVEHDKIVGVNNADTNSPLQSE